MEDEPTIGRIVVYRSRTGAWSVPAIVAATQDTLNRELVEGGYCPDLSGSRCVHLVVFSPGRPMTAQEQVERQANFVAPSEHGADVNMGGTFREWDVRMGTNDGPTQEPGTWRWPVRR